MTTNGTALHTPRSSSTMKFQLPALPLSLSESLTAGTDIPPPPPSPSPKDPTPPPTPPNPLSQHPSQSSLLLPLPSSPKRAHTPTSPLATPFPEPRLPPITSATHQSFPAPSTTTITTGSTSPPSTRRPGSSVRKFLSLKSLNSIYSNHSHARSSDALPSVRPSSPFRSSRDIKRSNVSRARRRSTMILGFGGRSGAFGSGDDKLVVEKDGDVVGMENILPNDEEGEKEMLVERPVTPPPMLPEVGVGSGGMDGGFFGGGEMFRDIK